MAIPAHLIHEDADASSLFGAEVVVPSTAAQKEIFSASRMEAAASRGYNHSISIHLTGTPDLDALYSSLLNLVARHEALRGRFSPDGSEFRVRERIPLELPLVDLTSLATADREAEYARLIRAELDYVFDLTEGPLFRAQLIRRGGFDWVLVFNCHHVVVDGWSLKIILEDLPKLYSELVRGRTTSAMAPAASYTQYLRTALAREQESSEKVRAFWSETFADQVPVLELPCDKPRPRIRTFDSLREDFVVERAVYDKLRAVGAKRGASQFITVLSAFALYIGRISGQRDFVIGVPAAGQITTGKSGLLGHDARLMPIRCVIQDDDTFATLTQRMLDRFLAAYEHQWISMPELIQTLDVEVDAARVPFISVMFNFDPGLSAESLKFEGLEARHFFNHRNSETFEISLNAVIEHDDLVLEWAYSSVLFEREEMHRRLEQFQELMRSIGDAPDERVMRLKLVPQAQVDAMDAALNSTAMEFETALCVDQLIERVVAATPERIAVEHNATRLTYRQLWERSSHVAAAIARANAGPKPLVGVMLERSADMVAVLLGVWRAGGAFVPLDPAYPPDRLDYMIEHSGMRLLLTDVHSIDAVARDGLQCLDVATIAPSSALLPVGRNPEDLAYVIYTSGSTGKPKGVQVPQRALNNFLTTMRQAPGIAPDDRLLAVTTLSFDIAELELWLPLVSGATTIVLDRAVAMDGAALVRTLREQRINFLQATPATWRLLMFAGWQGDARLKALCGGEALPRDLVNELLPRVGSLWNMYGPTETTVWSTLDRVTSDSVTIGKPIGNTQAYVLDATHAWVPRGSVGELWLGGSGVTHGYLGREDLTRERFVPNPFTRRGTMYRTGDLVRLRADGRIEYVGRNDFQVKVRGYRIELGEVQFALARVANIAQCAVAVREKSPGDAHLAAYYSTRDRARLDGGEIREALRATLPEYMIPGWFVQLEQLPLTDNGKVNVKALPNPFNAANLERANAFEQVEKLLVEHPSVRSVALVLPTDAPADMRPIACVVPRDGAEPCMIALRKHLRGRIPEPLIPEIVYPVEALPMTRRREVDRERLLKMVPGALRRVRSGAGAPATPMQVTLAKAWRDILGVADIEIHDNFFDLGGHSLSSVQMIARIERETGRALSPRLLVTETLEQIARRLDDSAVSLGAAT